MRVETSSRTAPKKWHACLTLKATDSMDTCFLGCKFQARQDGNCFTPRLLQAHTVSQRPGWTHWLPTDSLHRTQVSTEDVTNSCSNRNSEYGYIVGETVLGSKHLRGRERSIEVYGALYCRSAIESYRVKKITTINCVLTTVSSAT